MTFPDVLTLNHLIDGAVDEAVHSADNDDVGSPVDYNGRHFENSAGDASSPGLHQDDADEGIIICL